MCKPSKAIRKGQVAMDMLSAYYGRKTDAENLFKGLKISHDESYDRHINKYDVLKINMQDFFECYTQC